ncbi:Ku protein [Streptomyces sp. NPDC055287]
MSPEAEARSHSERRSSAPPPDRIRNRRVNERTGDEADLDDIVTGYDLGGECVPGEPKELDEIAPGRWRLPVRRL